MPENQTDRAAPAPAPWHVPVAVEDVAEAGKHFDLVADAKTRAALARLAGLRELPRLRATFDVSRYGASGLRVVGRVSATVGQFCVVTLEPLVSEIDEEVQLLFAPPAVTSNGGEDAAAKANDDNPEPLSGGLIDLGTVATEFLILGIDPYPRKPGAVFEPPKQATPDQSPFAPLAALKQHGDGRR
ncbi:MAG: DUF177 domain-containing protein [Hyphomicrobiales bacterium]|nr:DUF177 domain-containing protein [Hyphomicrobiales bacterium]